MSSLCQLDLTEAFDTGDHELLLRRTLHECISLLTYLHTSRPPANTAVRSVTLNLANRFSQCTFSVAEHYDLFSDLIILRQRDGVDRMTS